MEIPSLVQLCLEKVTLRSILESNVLSQEIPTSLRQQLEAIFTFENIIIEELYTRDEHDYVSTIDLDFVHLERMIPQEIIEKSSRPHMKKKETINLLYHKIVGFFTHPGHTNYAKGSRIFWEKRDGQYCLYETVKAKKSICFDEEKWKVTFYTKADDMFQHHHVKQLLDDFSGCWYVHDLDKESRRIANVLMQGRRHEIDELWEKLKQQQLYREYWNTNMAPDLLRGSGTVFFVIHDFLYYEKKNYSWDRGTIDIYGREDGYCLLAWYLWTSEDWKWQDHPFVQGQKEEEKLPVEEEIANPLQ